MHSRSEPQTSETGLVGNQPLRVSLTFCWARYNPWRDHAYTIEENGFILTIWGRP